MQHSIDIFLCKITAYSSESIAGILLTTLSDHFPYFISLAYSTSGKRTDKYIEIKQTSHVSINNFKNEIADYDIDSKITRDIDSDSNINYDIIHNILNPPLSNIWPLKSSNLINAAIKNHNG